MKPGASSRFQHVEPCRVSVARSIGGTPRGVDHWVNRGGGLHLVPRHDAAQVGAHGVHAEVRQRAVVVHNQVGGITLHLAPFAPMSSCHARRRCGEREAPVRVAREMRGVREQPRASGRARPPESAWRPKCSGLAGKSQAVHAGERIQSESTSRTPVNGSVWRECPQRGRAPKECMVTFQGGQSVAARDGDCARWWMR